MIKKIEAWCLDRGLLKNKQKILIACSGGPDSLALADILLKLREKYELELAAAHFNHMFRGKAADLDAEFVESYCRKNSLRCYQGKADVPSYIKTHRLSPEEGARLLRYEFLRGAALNMGGADIATAHHEGDQAETVLLHLLRGSGSAGLGGMRAKSHGIIRPFLCVSRREIEDYCKKEGLTPRLDATNLDTKYSRNRMRLEILPKLEKDFNPAVKRLLCQSAELFAAEHDFIRLMAEDFLKNNSRSEKNSLKISRNGLKKLHKAVAREAIRLAAEKKSGNLTGISFSHVERMIELTKCGAAGTFLELPHGLHFYCDYETMSMEDRRRETSPNTAEHILKVGTVNEAAGYAVSVELLETLPKNNKKNDYQIVLDYDKIEGPLCFRFRRAGDVFQPLGMNGRKKLKDFFIDEKVPQSRRDAIPLICDAHSVLWVVGVRQGERARLTENTHRFLRINVSLKDD